MILIFGLRRQDSVPGPSRAAGALEKWITMLRGLAVVGSATRAKA
jgi:hypothetical protein